VIDPADRKVNTPPKLESNAIAMIVAIMTTRALMVLAPLHCRGQQLEKHLSLFVLEQWLKVAEAVLYPTVKSQRLIQESIPFQSLAMWDHSEQPNHLF
jgi:hypothetical protein